MVANNQKKYKILPWNHYLICLNKALERPIDYFVLLLLWGSYLTNNQSF